MHPLVAVNDTRQPAEGSVEVIDVASGDRIYKGNFSIEANGRTLIDTLPERDGQGILLIKYTIDGKEYANHYLYGKPPFKLNEYKELLRGTNIYSLK
jgi:beta-mannosidase